MSRHLIYWIIIIGLLLVVVYLRACSQPVIITETKTETIVERDTVVVVDTVYVETIPEDERDVVEGEGESEVEDTEEHRLIRSSYSDSMIQITSNVRIDLLTGNVIDTRFQYLLKRRYVRERQLELNVRTTTTHTVTRTVMPGPYLSVGVIAGSGEITPLLGYTLRNRTTVFAGYDLESQSLRVGGMVPLRSLF